MSVGLLVDVTRCTGCERCVDACVQQNRLDPAKADQDRATLPDGLSANRLTTVQPLGSDHFAKKACMHCLEPSCVSACLVGGLTKRSDGAVVYDPDKCIGCRYCMLACPFEIPRYQWDRTVPFMAKCELCEEKTAEGGEPACVEACEEGVLKWGQRDDLLAEARRRLQNYPNLYVQRIWGEHEFGGTSVLYISDVDLEELGWPASETESIPHMTEPVLMATPAIGGSVLAGVAGVNWIIRRRMKLRGEESHAEGGEQ
ncbi:4Fe-4S dicluster domain-containing protein [bacterium]|nr:4Fe-4S dicluster domain-containing protein [bacterium]